MTDEQYYALIGVINALEEKIDHQADAIDNLRCYIDHFIPIKYKKVYPADRKNPFFFKSFQATELDKECTEEGRSASKKLMLSLYEKHLENVAKQHTEATQIFAEKFKPKTQEDLEKDPCISPLNNPSDP